jgi:hypothetical protein
VCEGKASLVKLTTRLQEDDSLPVTGMKSHRLYATRRAVEAEHHMVYAEKFAALPRYLHDICRKNPGSWQDIQINEHTGEFMAAFFAFGPAVELMKTVGRNVSGADFGHSTSPVYTHLTVLSSYTVAVTVPLSLRIVGIPRYVCPWNAPNRQWGCPSRMGCLFRGTMAE